MVLCISFLAAQGGRLVNRKGLTRCAVAGEDLTSSPVFSPYRSRRKRMNTCLPRVLGQCGHIWCGLLTRSRFARLNPERSVGIFTRLELDFPSGFDGAHLVVERQRGAHTR